MQEIAIYSNASTLTIKEYMGQRVITFKDVDNLHQRPDGTAKRNFNENRTRFIEGEDFFIVKPADVQKYEFRTSEINNRGTVLLTKMGYLMLVKSFTDDLAWHIQRQLVKSYFEGGGVSAPAPALKSIERRLEALEQATGAQTADISEVGATFLQAIRAAIDSGECYIKQKYKPYKGKPGILLGTRGRTETAVKTLLAYKIYSEYAAHPLSRMALWGLLERSGIILEREGLPYTVSFGDGKCGAIYIKNEKLEGSF